MRSELKVKSRDELEMEKEGSPTHRRNSFEPSFGWTLWWALGRHDGRGGDESNCE